MYQAVYPTCLVNFLKVLAGAGIKFNLVGGDILSGFVTPVTNAAPDYKFERVGYTSSFLLQ